MRKLIPIIAMLLVTFVARADFSPGPPEEVVLMFLVGAAIVIFFLSALLFWGLNKMIYRFVSKRIKFPWVQSLINVFLIWLLVSDSALETYIEEYGWEHGPESRKYVWILLISVSILVSWGVGFLIAPRRKSK